MGNLTVMEPTAPTFTPAEAAQLTGVSPDQQRDWRRNGIIPAAAKGWTRYSVSEISRLLLLRMFASRLGPAASLEAVSKLVDPLSARVEAVIAGEREPTNGDQAAAIWATDEVGVYATAQAALDAATEAQQAGPMTLIDLNVFATGFGIKVRDLVRNRTGAGS